MMSSATPNPEVFCTLSSVLVVFYLMFVATSLCVNAEKPIIFFIIFLDWLWCYKHTKSYRHSQPMFFCCVFLFAPLLDALSDSHRSNAKTCSSMWNKVLWLFLLRDIFESDILIFFGLPKIRYFAMRGAIQDFSVPKLRIFPALLSA